MDYKLFIVKKKYLDLGCFKKYEIYDDRTGETVKMFHSKEQLKIYLQLIGLRIGRVFRNVVISKSFILVESH